MPLILPLRFVLFSSLKISMKSNSLPGQLPLGLLLLLLGVNNSACFSQARVPSPKNGEKSTARNAFPEEDLLSVARGSGTNILVDSTSIPASLAPEEIDPATRGPAQDVVNALVSAAQTYHLSSQRLAPNTFVAWPEPDQRVIALAVAQGEGFGAEKGNSSPEKFATQLLAFFHPQQANANDAAPVNHQRATRQGNDQRAAVPTQVQEFELSQLPIDLRSQVVAFVLNQEQGFTPRDYAELWLRPEVWQKARLVYSADDPTIGGTYRTLLVHYVLETPQGRFLMSLDAFEGASRATPLGPTATQAATAPPTEETPLRILSVNEAQAATDAKPVLVDDVLRPSGAALKVLEEENRNPDLPSEELAAKVSVDATRQPLGQFLSEVTKSSKIALELPTDKDEQKLMISAHVQDMPLSDLMNTLSRLYGANWVKDGIQTWRLVAGHRSPVEMELQRVGFLPWYKFREVNTSARNLRKANFDTFAAQLVIEAGNDILSPTGIPLSSLSPNSQKELRNQVEWGLTRQIVLRQITGRDLLSGKWSFRLLSQPTESPQRFGPGPRLLLAIDGKPRAAMRLPVARG